MAWTTPRTWVAGELVTASLLNTHVRDNLNALRTGGIAIASQGANEIIFASSATQLSRSSSFLYDGTSFSVGTLGTHAFTASGTGENILRVRASSAGTGNAGILNVGNDSDQALCQILALSSTYTPAADLLANGIAVRSNGAGGLSLTAGHASGTIRFYAGGFTERANLSTAGVLSVSGFGSHVFSAGSAGVNQLTVRNTTAGTGNYGALNAGADGSLTISMLMFSSTWTTTTNQVQSGGSLETSGSGGLSLAATHASGVLRLYGNGTTQRMQVAAGVTVGDTTDPGNTNFRVAGTSALVGNVTLSGVALGSAGTAGAPMYSFSSDTDTGMFWTSGVLQFSVNGASRFTVAAPSAPYGNGIAVSSGAFGTGNFTGPNLFIGRNTSGSGAAGHLQMTTGNANLSFLWVDGSAAPGLLRISTAAPEEDGTPSDTSGTVVGDQTSWYSAKRVLRKRTDPDVALRAVLATPVFDFQYKASSYLDPQGKPAVFTGVVGRKRSAWFLKNVGPQQHPCLNEINVAGYHTLAIQALARQLAKTRAELRTLQRQSRTV